MNTDMTGFRCFSNIFASLCFGQSSLSIGRVEEFHILTLLGSCHACGIPMLVRTPEGKNRRFLVDCRWRQVS